MLEACVPGGDRTTKANETGEQVQGLPSPRLGPPHLHTFPPSSPALPPG